MTRTEIELELLKMQSVMMIMITKGFKPSEILPYCEATRKQLAKEPKYNSARKIELDVKLEAEALAEILTKKKEEANG